MAHGGKGEVAVRWGGWGEGRETVRGWEGSSQWVVIEECIPQDLGGDSMARGRHTAAWREVLGGWGGGECMEGLGWRQLLGRDVGL